MNKQEKEAFIRLTSELQNERQCCDLLADALIQGGMDRTFEALTYHELLRNGIMYSGVKVGNSPESKPKKRGRHPCTRQNPPIRWQQSDQDEEQ